MDSDLAIAQRAKLLPIQEITGRLGLLDEEVEPYGRYKAKVRLEPSTGSATASFGKYIVVTGITPTPLGEGKTVTTVGLAQGLAHIGKRAACCIRQPSMGPVFGIKGGAAGGGYSQVLPDGGPQPPPDRRHARGHQRPRPAQRHDRHPADQGQPRPARPDEGRLAALRGHERRRPARHRRRARRARLPARDGLRPDLRQRGDGRAGAGHAR